MKFFGWGLLACCLVAVNAFSAPDKADPRRVAPPRSTGQFVLRVLPKSFDRNPNVDMTVFGEVSPQGFSAPIPSASTPVYYSWRSGGFREEGGLMRGERRPDPKLIETQVIEALHAAGYRSETSEHPASLFITFSWGAMYSGHTDRISRATMIGGHKYAQELKTVLEKEIEERRLTQISPTRFTVAHQAFINFMPLERYKREDQENASLLEQSLGDIYFIIVSAFDAKELEQKRLIRLWRTHMTVDARGVSMADTLPVAIRNSVQYLGKDTGRPGSLIKPVLRSGKVEIGDAKVIEFVAPAAPAQPATNRK